MQELKKLLLKHMDKKSLSDDYPSFLSIVTLANLSIFSNI